jgi:hypothetical protein
LAGGAVGVVAAAAGGAVGVVAAEAGGAVGIVAEAEAGAGGGESIFPGIVYPIFGKNDVSGSFHIP